MIDTGVRPVLFSYLLMKYMSCKTAKKNIRAIYYDTSQGALSDDVV